MNFQDFFPSAHIRSADTDLTVKASRTHDRRIQNIHTVCCCHNNDSFIIAKSIHLYQHLVQCLLTFVMTSAHTGTTFSGNCIDLIDEDNTWCMQLCFRKQITYTGCSDADKHFHKIRTGNTEKRNTCLTCNRFCKQCFSGSRRSYQQDSFGNTCSYLKIFFRFFQKFYDFLQIFFFFLQTRYIFEGNFFLVRHRHRSTAFSKIHHFGITPR